MEWKFLIWSNLPLQNGNFWSRMEIPLCKDEMKCHNGMKVTPLGHHRSTDDKIPSRIVDCGT